MLSRFALFTLALAGLFVAASPADEVVRIMAANISSGNNQSYDPGHGNRIFQGLKPDIALVQEMNVGNNAPTDYQAWVAANFGAGFSYYCETNKVIPNGIVSRYPILSSGFWEDAELTEREFAWARIDIPGDTNLWAISVHLKASGDSVTRRNNQATALRAKILSDVPAGDYVVIGGDFNTYSRTESCVNTLSSVVVTTAPWPADQANNNNTNSSQGEPYDWVMPSAALAARSTPLVIGTNTHTNGLVFDSRDYTPLSAVSPVQSGDSGATGMQHMAVMRAFLIPTNEAPLIAQGTSVAVTLSRNNTPTAFSRSLNATDADGDPLAWSISTAAGHGTAGIVAPATGGSVALSYTPATNYTGTDSFVVRISDGQGGTDTITVNLTIEPPPNVLPVITQGTSVAVTLSKNNTPVAFSRSLNATDADSDSLTWSIFTAAAHGTAGIVAPAAGGSVALSYVPVTNFTGTDSFVVQVADGRGGTDTITVNLTIEPPPNIVPVISDGSSVAVTLSKNITPTAFNRSLAATDADLDPLTWSISTAASHGTAGVISPATGGSVALSYVPATNYIGTDSFVVQVADGRGGTDTITVNLTIEEAPNVLPVIGEGGSVTVTLSKNNTPTSFALGLSATDADSDPLTWSIVTPAGHGSANVVAPATGSSVTLSYVPASDYTGSDSFVVQVADGRGGIDTITVNLTIEEPPNTLPVIAGPAEVLVTLSQNGYPGAFSQELSATDPDSDPLGWSVISPAANGSASVVAPATGGAVALNYDPAPGYAGSDAFTVQVSDSRGGTDTVIIQLTVEAAPAYDAWTFDHFSPLAPETEATLWGEDADPDQDGYTNLQEFAHGLDPSLADAAPNLMTISGQSTIVLSYKIRMDGPSPALSYVVEATTDPVLGWTALPAEEYSLTGESDLGGGFKRRTLQLTAPNPPSASFFRLRFAR